MSTRERVEARHEQADSRGQLELVENRRTWMLLELEDEDGYWVAWPSPWRNGISRFDGNADPLPVLSERKDFSRISAFSDAWLPGLRMWAGEYPFCCDRPLKNCANAVWTRG
ncbi:MAG: hypothetical protein CM15mP77_1270 [Synechococcus sp.]|nr:MAG: hypothetical protein CM15mP77_1270 [Synechococcus sp.]